MRRRRPPPKVRPLRRVEVRPGRQAQVAFSLSLSSSRMWSVQWRLEGQLSWQEAHNRAFEAVQGVPWSVRFDNCKTAVVRRGGPWAILNDDYASYARQLGFVPDACRVRQPTDKGKVERRLRDVRWNLVRTNERFETLAELQTSDLRVPELCTGPLPPRTKWWPSWPTSWVTRRYGVFRQLTAKGHECMVVAPSLIFPAGRATASGPIGGMRWPWLVCTATAS